MSDMPSACRDVREVQLTSEMVVSARHDKLKAYRTFVESFPLNGVES